MLRPHFKVKPFFKSNLLHLFAYRLLLSMRNQIMTQICTVAFSIVLFGRQASGPLSAAVLTL